MSLRALKSGSLSGPKPHADPKRYKPDVSSTGGGHKPANPDSAHRPLSSSFVGLPYRILNMNHKKELLRGL